MKGTGEIPRGLARRCWVCHVRPGDTVTSTDLATMMAVLSGEGAEWKQLCKLAGGALYNYTMNGEASREVKKKVYHYTKLGLADLNIYKKAVEIWNRDVRIDQGCNLDHLEALIQTKISRWEYPPIDQQIKVAARTLLRDLCENKAATKLWHGAHGDSFTVRKDSNVDPKTFLPSGAAKPKKALEPTEDEWTRTKEDELRVVKHAVKCFHKDLQTTKRDLEEALAAGKDAEDALKVEIEQNAELQKELTVAQTKSTERAKDLAAKDKEIERLKKQNTLAANTCKKKQKEIEERDKKIKELTAKIEKGQMFPDVDLTAAMKAHPDFFKLPESEEGPRKENW